MKETVRAERRLQGSSVLELYFPSVVASAAHAVTEVHFLHNAPDNATITAFHSRGP